MDNPISSTPAQTPPVQAPQPSRTENEPSLEQRQQQPQRAEATQENTRAQERRPDPDERLGTQIDTQA